MTSPVFQVLQGVDLGALTAVQRLLLTTDGTLTDALEVALLEPIALLKISQRLVSPTGMHDLLQLNGNERVLERRIVLWGRRTGRHYVYAESMVAIDRLQPGLRQDLLESDVPLGRLWVKHRLETYKQLLSVDCEAAPDLPPEFKPSPGPVLGRTYLVFAAGVSVMAITERFSVPLDI